MNGFWNINIQLHMLETLEGIYALTNICVHSSLSRWHKNVSENLAYMRPAYQKEEHLGHGASLAVDDPNVYTYTDTFQTYNPWWLVQLPYNAVVSIITLMRKLLSFSLSPWFLLHKSLIYFIHRTANLVQPITLDCLDEKRISDNDSVTP